MSSKKESFEELEKAFGSIVLTGPPTFKQEAVKLEGKKPDASNYIPTMKLFVDTANKKIKKEMPDNSSVRKLYSQLQLLKIEMEGELKSKSDSMKENKEEFDALKKDFDDKINKLQAMSDFLKIERKKKGWLMFVDNTLRFFSFAAWLMMSATILSPISIFCKPVDDMLAKYNIISPRFKISTIIKRLVGYVACVVAGVQIITEGLDDPNGKAVFGEKSYVTCFSHASNLDVFVLAASTPIFHPCPGKADLFFIPFFSWILYACGVIPIHRSDQEQAIKVLDKIASAMVASGSGDCIAISPEGTRSKSGMILEFKSGPFYQAEAANLPVIPVVIVGASDLWPATGTLVNSTGKVYVRYLTPIDQGKKIESSDPKDPAREANRKRVSKEVRVSMLKTLLNTVPDKKNEIDTSFRLQMHFFHSLIIWMSCYIWNAMKRLLFERFSLTTVQALFVVVGTPLLLTAALFIFIEIQIKFMKPKDKKDKKI